MKIKSSINLGVNLDIAKEWENFNASTKEDNNNCDSILELISDIKNRRDVGNDNHNKRNKNFKGGNSHVFGSSIKNIMTSLGDEDDYGKNKKNNYSRHNGRKKNYGDHVERRENYGGNHGRKKNFGDFLPTDLFESLDGKNKKSNNSNSKPTKSNDSDPKKTRTNRDHFIGKSTKSNDSNPKNNIKNPRTNRDNSNIKSTKNNIKKIPTNSDNSNIKSTKNIGVHPKTTSKPPLTNLDNSNIKSTKSNDIHQGGNF